MKLLQRLASLQGGPLRLCPVFFNGKMILVGQAPEVAAPRVDVLQACVQPAAIVPGT